MRPRSAKPRSITPFRTPEKMRARADLTFKENVQRGRHGWLRLTPAYSVRLVDQVLDEFGEGATSVFEPFSGTGTTPLCAAYRGLRAVATDINPFLVWLGRVKGAHYAEADRAALRCAANHIAKRSRAGKARAVALPPLKNIERWWHPAELAFLSGLRGEILRHEAGASRDLLDVAFCRTMIALSNAAFNHQSMSFRHRAGETPTNAASPGAADAFVERFLSDVETVHASATDNPRGSVRIERRDARGTSRSAASEGAFDLLVTSPPYPNRMSYIRELRPYMYWLGYLGEARDAGELDWEAIGGTWGIATSRLSSWKPGSGFVPRYLSPIAAKIRASHPKNGELMARYVHKYFEDMFAHFESAARLVKRGGSAHYVVGNSAFYGHLVPSERLYCDQLREAGFARTESRAIRKRNSKKELVEFHVIAWR